MRIAGWGLLLAGFVLCLSVAWAALGFLLMGFGLVSLQAGERKRRKAEKAAAVAVAGLDAHPEPAAAVAEASPVQTEDATVASAPAPVLTPEAERHADLSAYDREAWHRLVKSDPDLARLAAVLADYGQQHVDEFASSYLAKPDKSRLGAIVNEIIAKAARTQSVPVTPQLEVHRPSIEADQEPRSPDTPPEPNNSAAKIHAPKVAVVPRATPDVRTATGPRIQSASAIRLEPTPEDESETITSAEDDLSELIRKFANDTSFVRR
jgi:hypothetical protein